MTIKNWIQNHKQIAVTASAIIAFVLNFLTEKYFKIGIDFTNISNSNIDDLYEYFLTRGVFGAKLLGAGSSGYMLIAASSDTIDGVESDAKFKTLRLIIDRVGTQVVYDSSKF
jgi:galactokinase/mevalonate kinase-like predicted kinase